VAVWVLAFVYGRGGFDLVLGVTAVAALLVDVVFIAVAQPKDQRGRVTVDSDWSG
jgi:hypothetical protein